MTASGTASGSRTTELAGESARRIDSSDEAMRAAYRPSRSYDPTLSTRNRRTCLSRRTVNHVPAERRSLPRAKAPANRGSVTSGENLASRKPDCVRVWAGRVAAVGCAGAVAGADHCRRAAGVQSE
jgi:hypothetical protein